MHRGVPVLAALAALAACAAGGLPGWYDAHRIHAHTRLVPDSMCNATTGRCEPVFEDAAALFAGLGVPAFVRHAHTGNEGVWWPNPRLPKAAWAPFVANTNRNVVQEMISKAKAANITAILYYWTYASAYFEAQNPSWRVLNATGQPVDSGRGNILCVNSPWRQEVKKQLVEVAAMGASGFYYDHYSNPPTGCFCEHCRAKFKAETGYDLPNSTDPADPVYKALLEFNTRSVQEHWEEVLGAVHASWPEVVHVLSTYEVPCVDNGNFLYETSALAQANDATVTKSEMTLPVRHFCDSPYLAAFPPDLGLAFGWSFARDGARGRPAHLWAPHIGSSAQALGTVAALVTYGNIANPDHTESAIPNRTLYGETYALAARIAPALAGTRPLPWVAVYHSEAVRNRAFPRDPTAAQEAEEFPALAAFQAMAVFAGRAPTSIAVDRTVAEGGLLGANGRPAYRALLLPFPRAAAPPNSTARLAAYEAAGGHIIALPTNVTWRQPVAREAAEKALVAAVVQAVGPPPVSVLGGGMATVFHGMTVHATASQRPDTLSEVVVAMTNNITWAKTASKSAKHPPTPPRPATNITVALTNVLNAPTACEDVASGTHLTLQPGPTPNSWSVHIPTLANLAVLRFTCGSGPCFQPL